MARQPAVYILSNAPHGTLYIGVTSNLCARIWQHRHDLVPGFSRSYRTYSLVWFEIHESMYGAITREKQLKEWRRPWKIRLIRATNPQWRDLCSEICS
jgi:putative endonuclease